MKIPVFDDFDPDDPDIEFRKKRWDYWGILKKVREEYLAEETISHGLFIAYDFGVYVEKNYGIKMHIVNGNITDKYDIVDKKLYTYFLLKFV